MTVERPFLNTNVLLYLLSADAAKADAAEALLRAGGVVSVQVLNEFAAVASRKLRMDWSEIAEALMTIRAFCDVRPLTLQAHDAALALAARHGYTIYDSLILASAMSAGCRLLWSEDMQDGQRLGDLLIRNPFRPVDEDR